MQNILVLFSLAKSFIPWNLHLSFSVCLLTSRGTASRHFLGHTFSQRLCAQCVSQLYGGGEVAWPAANISIWIQCLSGCICVFWRDFFFWSIHWLFWLVFTWNIYVTNIEKTFLGACIVDAVPKRVCLQQSRGCFSLRQIFA